MTCRDCDKTDGCVYTSFPPKLRCTITGEYHDYIHKCDVDFAPVVRCKDCRYYEIMQLKKDGTDDRRYKPSLCVLHNRNFDEDYYCADGERREVTE